MIIQVAPEVLVSTRSTQQFFGWGRNVCSTIFDDTTTMIVYRTTAVVIYRSTPMIIYGTPAVVTDVGGARPRDRAACTTN